MEYINKAEIEERLREAAKANGIKSELVVKIADDKVVIRDTNNLIIMRLGEPRVAWTKVDGQHKNIEIQKVEDMEAYPPFLGADNNTIPFAGLLCDLEFCFHGLSMRADKCRLYREME